MRFPRKVYAIQHNVTKKIYIGSSNDVETRYKSHIWALRGNKHNVPDMQEDYNKYGEDYSVFILGEMSSYAEKGLEYEWMRKYNTITRGVGYNYKDQERVISHSVNYVPYKDGLPEKAADIGQAPDRIS